MKAWIETFSPHTHQSATFSHENKTKRKTSTKSGEMSEIYEESSRKCFENFMKILLNYFHVSSAEVFFFLFKTLNLLMKFKVTAAVHGKVLLPFGRIHFTLALFTLLPPKNSNVAKQIFD